MAIYQQLPFTPAHPTEPMELPSDIPKELDIFFRNESHFLPEGKTFAELTPEELDYLKACYRFDPLRPGVTQTISGFGNMI